MSGEEEEHVEDVIELEPGTTIRDVWAVVRKLGKGAYGQVYHVINIKTGVQGALKTESKSQADRVLKMERNVLQGFKGVKGAMKLISMGTTDTYSYIVMTLCGADLTHLCKTMGTLTDSTIIRVAIRTLLALKQLHEIGFIHRDVKPCNFAVSCESPRIIHVIDFGMTRKYASKNEKSEWCIKRRRNRAAFRGTLRYCSLSVHRRSEQGRVDDLWSWAYMSIEMRDPLPWSRASHPEAVLGLKEDTALEKICSSEITKVFVPIMKTFNKLGYFDRPDYKKIFEMLMDEVTKLKVKMTDPYDWDGKITDTETAEKLEAVCKQYGIKYENLPKMETVEDLSEKSEMAYLRQVFSPQPTDVPGGEQYEEKKKKAPTSSVSNINTEAQSATATAVPTAPGAIGGSLEDGKHPITSSTPSTAPPSKAPQSRKSGKKKKEGESARRKKENEK
ncbi:Serine threonine protein kinase domain containing protein [Trichostrongylus colubriformis]|uniref:Serine threonine protein kinase domain containing protein n=1 Tax=Trichostrongylus colubriformis TaxID=6319 RepID=A0AAN8IVB6_TRICO